VEWRGLLARPIGPDGVQTIDLTYPYANTKNGTLEPHHGVEFPNGTGTPVLAAQDGEVVFAGSDELTVLGPYTGFYGNVVILRHTGLFEGRDLYTLYAHLSAVDVSAGQQVELGERIGAVGLSGAATGSHLHFEVRLDENDYAHTTNPVLWLGPAGSTLAGILLDRYGRPVDLTTIELDLVGPDGAVLQNYYPITYFPSGVNANPILNENFVFPDLPPGDYRLNYIWDRYYTFEFSLSAGSLGFIKIQLD
jgi:murein DD-endopeptidase MepM/ murein hydrolase activator NlpD